MRLNKQTDYALRALMYLAKQEQGKRIYAQEIAKNYDMPINHLTKIIHKLGQLSYIHTYRGRNGGIELGKAKEEILIRQVIVDFEPSLHPADCDNCLLNDDCGLRQHLTIASEAFLKSLDQKSLADMVT